MAEDDLEMEPPAGRPWWRWLAILAIGLPLLVLVLVPPTLWVLSETAAGRAFVARQVGHLTLESGMHFDVGRIDGSLFSDFVLHETTVHDLDGPLVHIPEASVSWTPRALLGRAIHFRDIRVPEVRLLRMPHLNPSDPDAPLLPDIRLTIGHFDIGRLILEPPVLGERESLSAAGTVVLDHGQLLTDVQATAEAGDRLIAKIDATPEKNRLDMSARLHAPATGMLMRAAGLEDTLDATLDGKGDWAAWQGQFDATLGTEEIARLGIRANDGTFRVDGRLMPAPLLPEAAQETVSPAIDVHLTAKGDGDWYDLGLRAASPAFDMSASGGIDPAKNLLRDVTAEIRVADAARLSPELAARNLHANLKADGKLRHPDASWQVSADALSVAGQDGPLGVERFALSGRIENDRRNRLSIPFDLRVGRFTGLAPDVAGLLAGLNAKGALGYAKGTLTVSALKAESAGLAADAQATLSPGGEAKGRLDARLKRYVVDGLGPVSGTLGTDFRQKPGKTLPIADGRFALNAGPLANGSLAALFGSPPALNGRFRLDEKEILALEAVQLTSARVRLNGRGHYRIPDARFEVAADATSKDHGPLRLRAAGTVDRPAGTLAMERPDLGMGLKNVVIDLAPHEGEKGHVRILARGESDYGPLDGDVRVLYGAERPLDLDIRHFLFAGFEAAGRVVQTAAGPFDGRVIVTGQGLDASVALAATDAVQRADIAAHASKARIPLATPLDIGAAVADIRILMVPGAPDVHGGLRAERVRWGTVRVDSLTGRADISGMAGTATLRANGETAPGKAFAADTTLSSTTQGYRLDVDGRLGKLPLKLDRPAEIIRLKDGWKLERTRIVLPKGSIDVFGRMARDRLIAFRLDNVDLASGNLIDPELGLTGIATGSGQLRLPAGQGLPEGKLSLKIARLSRAGVTGYSVPVDLIVAGGMDDRQGLELGGRLAMNDRNLGRLVLKLTPAARGTMEERLMNGQLSGGIRYNGSVQPLWALGGPEGQELHGALAVGVDFSGTPADPHLRGVAHGKNIAYRNTAFGTNITDIAFDGGFSDAGFGLRNLTGKAGPGTISGKGGARFNAEDGLRMNFAIDFDKAELANGDMARVRISGPLAITGRGKTATVSGDLSVDQADIVIAPFDTTVVPTVRVRREGETPEAKDDSLVGRIDLDIRIRAEKEILRVEGMGLDSLWNANIRIRGTSEDPQIFGRATLDKGEFNFASSSFKITNGRLTFNGAPMQSAINVTAETRAEEVTAVLRVSGTAEKPEIGFSSTPSLPEDEILSRLLFGSSVADLSAIEAVQLASAANGLRNGGIDGIGKIRRSIGLDRLKLVGGNDEGMGTGIAIGKKLMKNVYLEVVTDTQGNTLTQLEFTLTRILSLFAEVSSLGHDSVNLRYQRER